MIHDLPFALACIIHICTFRPTKINASIIVWKLPIFRFRWTFLILSLNLSLHLLIWLDICNTPWPLIEPNGRDRHRTRMKRLNCSNCNWENLRPKNSRVSALHVFNPYNHNHLQQFNLFHNFPLRMGRSPTMELLRPLKISKLWFGNCWSLHM